MVRNISHDKEEPTLEELERTLAALREDSEVAHVLLGLSSTLAEFRLWEETLQTAVRIVPELLGTDRCFAATLDRGRMIVNAHHGYSEAELLEVRSFAEDPDSLHILRQALDERRPVFVEDSASDPRMSPQEASARGIKSLAAIPLFLLDEEFGGLKVEFDRPRRFTSKDESLALGIARQLSVALVNARRFTLLQGLRNFGLRIGGRISLEGVARETAEGACDLLSGDGAALYLMEAATNQLVAAATHGTTPAPELYARIDASAEPWSGLQSGETVLLSSSGTGLPVDKSSPVAVVATPIIGSDALIYGAVGVFFNRSMTLSVEETEALRVLAAQSAMAIDKAQRMERQRRLARSLQEGLLTIDMPLVPGYRVGTVFEPASDEVDIGGDFYDVFDLGEGTFGLVVGDVSGKGAEAAAQTAQVKYVLRAFASRNQAPSSVLFHVNNALTKGFSEDRFATVVYAVLDSTTRTCHIALGGHPPPLLFHSRTGEVEQIALSGSILGAFPDIQFDQVRIDLNPRDALVAYTDGLIETRHEDELFGIERSRRAVARLAPGRDAADLARALFEEARRFGRVADDTAILVVLSEPTTE
jgi:serine phosphatase RsbU (regulator of sigma subunit)